MQFATATAERQVARIDFMVIAEEMETRARELRVLARQAREAALRANQLETNRGAA